MALRITTPALPFDTAGQCVGKGTFLMWLRTIYLRVAYIAVQWNVA